MTTLLSITARPDAPIACDLTGAEDTLDERRAKYRHLFDQALISRESSDRRMIVRLRADPGVRDRLLDLVRREAACCGFLSYEIRDQDDTIVWTISGDATAVLADFLS